MKYIFSLIISIGLLLLLSPPAKAFTLEAEENSNRYSLLIYASPIEPSLAAQIRFSVEGGSIVDLRLTANEDILIIGTCSNEDTFTSKNVCFDIALAEGEINNGDYLGEIEIEPEKSIQQVKIVKNSDNAYLLNSDTLYFDTGESLPFENFIVYTTELYVLFGSFVFLILVVGFGGAIFYSKKNKKEMQINNENSKVKITMFLVGVGFCILLGTTYLSINEEFQPRDLQAQELNHLKQNPNTTMSCTKSIYFNDIEFNPGSNNQEVHIEIRADLSFTEKVIYSERLSQEVELIENADSNCRWLSVQEKLEDVPLFDTKESLKSLFLVFFISGVLIILITFKVHRKSKQSSFSRKQKNILRLVGITFILLGLIPFTIIQLKGIGTQENGEEEERKTLLCQFLPNQNNLTYNLLVPKETKSDIKMNEGIIQDGSKKVTCSNIIKIN